jgi:penicillin-binding protein 1C
LPEKPLRLPQLAPHLLEKFIQEGKKGQLIESSIDQNLQEKALIQLQIHHELLAENQIMNGAIIITSVKTGEVLAYVGNTKTDEVDNSNDVNCIQAPRSTGSILKPFLYAKCLEDGILTPEMLVTDIPSQFGSFTPKNFSGQYDGALPASKALSRSLNIPMVHLLNQYGLTKFYQDLRKYGLTTLTKPSRHYGLSLILGGAEARLDELNIAYTQMAQELRFGNTWPTTLLLKSKKSLPKSKQISNRGCIYSTFESMIDVNRPDEDNNWRTFSSSQKIAWKTGTSFGFRDAWAIGITPDYVVAVWIGNADGEGRPGLTGISAAAPLMFDVFRQLPTAEKWFKAPKNELVYVPICHESGHRTTAYCTQKNWRWIPRTCLNSKECPYHQLIHLSKKTNQRVDSDCEDVFNMRHEKWFVLPSIIEKYYKFNHPNYKPLPEYKPECLSKISDKAMGIIYPKNKSKIYVPVEIDGKQGRTIFEATHRNMNTKIYWHLDDNFIGETKEIHQMSLNPAVGIHQLMLIDENGIMQEITFEVIGK